MKMGEEYPFYHPCHKPPKRETMREIKESYNKYLAKYSMSKVNKR